MKLNPDENKVKEIRLKLKNNKGYCPCMIEQIEDTKCPCKNMRDNKICICGLYIND
jgi:ferredoxin-thioredoxin reductase catalytic subunit